MNQPPLPQHPNQQPAASPAQPASAEQSGATRPAPASPTPPPPRTPAQQLDALREELSSVRREMLEFEPLKTSLDDLVERIATLEQALEGESDATAAYTEFYRPVERYCSEATCGIPGIRRQLGLSDTQVACIRKAVEAIDVRVGKALDASREQDAEVQALQEKQATLDAELAEAQRWYDFFRTGLQERITRQFDDLKALSQLTEPSHDPCEVWFYLNEMEAMLTSAHTDGNADACYADALNLATFVDCWSPDAYAAARQHWTVVFNDAERDRKIGVTRVEQAQKLAAELAEVAQAAVASRREWILKEIKAQACCRPT